MRNVRAWTLTLAAAAAAAPALAQEFEPDKWTRDVASTDAAVRREAAFKLNRCGADCEKALPALVKMMQLPASGDVGDAAAAIHQILQSVGSRALLSGQSESAAIAEGCGMALPVLRRSLKGASPAPIDATLAQSLSVSLLGLCAQAEDVETFSAIVSAPAFNVNVRQAAIYGLARLGPAAASAVPVLKAVGRNASDGYASYLGEMANEAVKRIQPPPAKKPAAKKPAPK